MTAPIHVVDATMFWSPTGGGVRRYLLAKHDWLARRPGWRHTLAVPGGTGAAVLPSVPLPGSGGYRVPLRRGAVARVLESLRPDLIEAGDPYRVAWGALDAARACRVPAVATCHSNLEAMARLAAGTRLGGIAARAARRYARHLYRRFDLVLANPPYIGTGETLPDEVRAHEPASALFAGADGLDDYRVLARQLPRLIAPSGCAAVEIGHTQAKSVAALFAGQGLTSQIHRDLGGRDRCLLVQLAHRG